MADGIGAATRRMNLAVVVVAGLVAAGCSGTSGTAPEESVATTVLAPIAPPSTTVALGIPAGDDTTVSRVIDGDTIEVAGGTRIRFIGIDTPETSTGPDCFGPEATTETRRLLPVDQRVRLVYDAERLDRFGRTLAYVYSLPDGLFVNLTLAERGFAVQATFPPNVAHVEEFRAATADARTSSRGLWAACPARRATTPRTTSPATPAPVTSPPTGAGPSDGGAGVSYASCGAARAAGAAPLQRGDPGYRSALDRDDDGVACE